MTMMEIDEEVRSSPLAIAEDAGLSVENKLLALPQA